MHMIYERVIDFLFPKACINCGIICDAYLCSHCKKFLVEIEPEDFLTRRKSKMWTIKDKNCPVRKVYYFYHYNNIIYKLIFDIKYKFHKDKVKEVAKLITNADEFRYINIHEIDFLTYIPISSKRMNWRGFNQTQLIAKELSKLLNIPYFTIAHKTKHTSAQIDLDREKRLTNIKGVFEASDTLPVNISGKSLLLIDDICTTGSTLLECARAIKHKYPHTTIYGLCLARGD